MYNVCLQRHIGGIQFSENLDNREIHLTSCSDNRSNVTAIVLWSTDTVQLEG